MTYFNRIILYLSRIKNHAKYNLACKLIDDYQRQTKVDLSINEVTKFCLVSVIRNEDQYLEEWIKFHIDQGVKIFFIYDNGATETERLCTKKILDQFISRKIVNYLEWPDIPGLRIGTEKNKDRKKFNIQELGFFHFYRFYSHFFDYYAKLDIDEFIYANNSTTIDSNLNFRGVRPVWGYNFGSSGKVFNEKESVITRFLYRGTELSHMKSINKSSDVFELFNAHIAFVKPWKIFINPAEYKVDQDGVLRLNHYRLKSKEEFINRKVAIKNGFQSGDYSIDEFNRIDLELNQVFDDLILRI